MRHHTLPLAAASIAAAAVAAAGLALAWRRLRRRRLAFTEAHVLASMLRSGELSSAELLEIFLERVKRVDAWLNAVVVHDFDRARARAAAADEARQRGELWGPLHGLPMTVKEEMAVAGLARCCGRVADAGHVDDASCAAVARVVEAGAIIFGKTNVPTGCLDWQAYNDVYGSTSNPQG